MPNYKTEPFGLIRNIYGCLFHKLYIDGKCHFEKFVQEIERYPNQKGSLIKVYSLMEKYSPYNRLPKEKFRQIKSLRRIDVYEFKDPPCVRIYVVLQVPNIYIVAGSTKNSQNATIAKLDNWLKDFKKTED